MKTLWMGTIVLAILVAYHAAAASKPIPATPLPPIVVQPDPTPTPKVETPVHAPVLAWGNKFPAWDKALDEGLQDFTAITVNLSDAATFCPAYNRLPTWERKNVWKQLVSIMGKFESGWNPKTTYDESSTKASLKGVISRGVLQISIVSANSYGCGFKDAQELHDPAKNLKCGLKIINRWVKEDKRFAGYVDGKWRGAARYWSVMRDLKGKKSYASIKAYMRALPVCQ